MATGSDKLDRDLVLAAVDLLGQVGQPGDVEVVGLSMLPTLQPGHRVIVDFGRTSPARGDLIVFRQYESLLVHRVLGPARRVDERLRLRTRGDGVPTLDPAVDPERIVGRVVALYDGARWRATRGALARVYGWCLAWHDLFWGAMAVFTRRFERRLVALRIPLRLSPAVAAADRGLILVAHRLFFRWVHPPLPDRAPPEGA